MKRVPEFQIHHAVQMNLISPLFHCIEFLYEKLDYSHYNHKYAWFLFSLNL